MQTAEKVPVSIGAGYNPGFLPGPNGEAALIPLPEGVSFLELGLAEYGRWRTSSMPPVDWSLHMARTPITEGKAEQEAFVKYVASCLRSGGHSRLVSVGLHLTGPRDSGIGRFGFSAHYTPSSKAEQAAMRFVGLLQDQLKIPVWIENANFYSESQDSILRSWESAEQVARRAQAELIVDISHLLIDCRNNKLSPALVLGGVPWDIVREVHLSGIMTARDGSMHDGHGAPVHSEVWELLAELINSGRIDLSRTIITIEHTDPSWIKNPDDLGDDFATLRGLRAKREPGPGPELAEAYAMRYLKKLLRQWLPRLELACEQRGHSFDRLAEEWIAAELECPNGRIVLTRDEIPGCDRERFRPAAEAFLSYAKERLV